MKNLNVALLWHGDRETRNSPKLDEHRLGPTAAAFRKAGLEPEPAVYSDAFVDEVRDQLLQVGAVQVWVNPINDQGGTRCVLDAMLKEVADAGVVVSAHPDTIQKMGTKNVVFDTREMGWGSDVHLYRSIEEMRSQLPGRLRNGPRVLKQHRGHSGQGIWKLSPTENPSMVLARHAPRGSAEVRMPLEEWIASCEAYFQEGPMLDQEFNPQIGEGMVRCYQNIARVGGFGFQEVNALVEAADPGPRLYFPPTDPRFQDLKSRLEREWLPEMLAVLGMIGEELPCLWDADFMFRNGGYMLCEINVSSVYPYPESAMAPLAEALKSRIEERSE